jgi:hypothetical protein
MTANTKKQLMLLGGLLAAYALLAFIYYLIAPLDQMIPGEGLPPELVSLPKWVIGLANAGIILVFYGIIGFAGYWFTIKIGVPGVYREQAGRRDSFVVPLQYGLVVGTAIVLADRFFASQLEGFELPHPPFPSSLIASATAAIGEEMLFRFFVMGLWAFLLNLIMRRWEATNIALWIANIIAALAFAAGHLPGAMFILNVTSPAQIPAVFLIEILVLNGLVGLIAGAQSMKSGLITAIGIHFWVDIVWHVAWPLIH